MKSNNILLIAAGVLALIIAGYYFVAPRLSPPHITPPIDSVPTNVTLSGTYVCLPYLDKARATSEECEFGLKTDDGVYYMVNFGASANAMTEFQNGARITAKGFVVPKEAVSTDHWVPYDMKGIFTITERLLKYEKTTK